MEHDMALTCSSKLNISAKKKTVQSLIGLKFKFPVTRHLGVLRG
jgi:hypothetical protein